MGIAQKCTLNNTILTDNMKNNHKRKLRFVVFSLGLAAMLLPASNLSAQDGGGLFGRGETDAGNRFGDSYSLFNQTYGTSTINGNVTYDGFGNTHNGGITYDGFGGDAPLGCGLLVMTAAAAGYAMLRQRKPGSKNQPNFNE